MRILGNRKVTGLQRPHWCLWRWQDIVLNGEKYLTRLNILATPLFSVKLHWIHRPDKDREGLHDHPWPFLSIILSGGYKERISKHPDKNDGRYIWRRWINFMGTKSAHRIDEVLPNTLTLVISGPRSKSWGFYDKNTFKFIDWKETDAGK